MTSTADRPAADLADARAAKILAEKDLTDCRDALARAEEALAAVERQCKMADRDYNRRVQVLGSTSGAGYPAVQVVDIRAALRASQGGQT